MTHRNSNEESQGRRQFLEKLAGGALREARDSGSNAVIVGMFPILTDEIAEDAEIARWFTS